MAERLPNETIELVLSLAYDPPDAEDVGVGRERERRALLWSASLVCRRWRPVAAAMLPASVVMRSADELAAHAAAHLDGTLNVARTTCLSVACFDMGDGREASLHALATNMPQLRYMRIACAAMWSGRLRSWPGETMVVGVTQCGRQHGQPRDFPEDVLFDVLDASPSFRNLAFPKSVNNWPVIGAAFGARVVSLRCGDARRPFGSEDAILGYEHGDSHLARLRSVHYCGSDFPEAANSLFAVDRGAHIAACPALNNVAVSLSAFALSWPRSEEETYASALLDRLPATCSRLTCALSRRSISAAADLRAAIGFVEVMASAIEVADLQIETLVVDVVCYELGEAWQSLDGSIAIAALEQVCAAKGIVLELRI